jgi:hypothetical protein
MVRNRILIRYLLCIVGAFVQLSVPVAAQKKGSGGSAPQAAPSASPSTPTASNAPMEVEMLSYGGLDKILDKVATYACSQNPQRVVILDAPTLQNLEAFDSFYANAEALRAAFEAMTPAAKAGGGIDDFADITNAVATVAMASTSESSFSFTILDPTVALVLLHHLQQQTSSTPCKNAYYAGVYSVHEIDNAKINGNPLNTVDAELNALAQMRSASLRSVLQGIAGVPCPATKTAVTGAVTGATITGGTTTGGTTTGGTTTGGTTTGGTTTGGTTVGGQATGGTPVLAVSSQDPCISAFNNLDGTYNSFLAGLSTPNAATNQPSLSSILQGYRLRALFQTATKTSPLLGVYVNVAVAGGTQQDRKNLLLSLFYGDLIRYSGGVSVNVIVFQVAGDDSKILFSDLLRYRTPLKQIKAPAGYDGAGSAGDNLGDLP